VRRPLVLEFAAPIAGVWLVTMELVPREPFPPAFGLPFPFAGGGQAAPPVFGWRAQGIQLTDARPAVASPLTADAFLKEYWQPAKVESDARPPTQAYQRSSAGPAPVIRLRATPVPRPRTTTDVHWHIQSHEAELKATARITADAAQFALVEWDVPSAVVITDVRGPEIHRWSRTGSRLQVWLTRPSGEATISVTGAIVRSTEGARFDVPFVRPRAVAVGGTLRVTAQEGLALTPVVATNLTEAAPPPPGGREWTYTTGPRGYRSAFLVRTATGTTDFQVHTEATVRAGRLAVTATIDARVRRAELRSFTVTARHVDGWQCRVAAGPGARVQSPGSGLGPQSWVIDLPPGITSEYRVTLTAERPADTNGEFVLPDVMVNGSDSGSTNVQRTVAATGPELNANEAAGLRRLPDGVGWKVVADNWRLALRTKRRSTPGGEPVRVELTDIVVARADDGRWLHRATLWLTKAAGSELRATWTTPVKLCALQIDGQWLPTPTSPAEQVSIPLMTRGAIARLELVWAHPGDGSPPTAAWLPTLTLAGEAVPMSTVLWSVLPALGSGLRPDAAPMSATTAALYRAAAQIRLAAATHTTSPAESQAARARAAAELRRADATLSEAADDPAGPNGITLGAWREQLFEAVQPGGEAVVAPVEGYGLPFDGVFERGVGSTWLLIPGDDGPKLTWFAPRTDWGIRLFRMTAVAAAGVLGVLCGRWFGRRAWPEQLALLGFAAWTAYGGIVWLAPTVVGVAARIWLLGRAVAEGWRDWRASHAPPSGAKLPG
jgi:hypothetical protein